MSVNGPYTGGLDFFPHTGVKAFSLMYGIRPYFLYCTGKGYIPCTGIVNVPYAGGLDVFPIQRIIVCALN
jgi:hypothetical protein